MQCVSTGVVFLALTHGHLYATDASPALHTIRPRQNCRHFADEICQMNFAEWNHSIWFKFHRNLFLEVHVDDKSSLVHVMAWCRIGTVGELAIIGSDNAQSWWQQTVDHWLYKETVKRSKDEEVWLSITAQSFWLNHGVAVALHYIPTVKITFHNHVFESMAVVFQVPRVWRVTKAQGGHLLHQLRVERVGKERRGPWAGKARKPKGQKGYQVKVVHCL